MERLYGHKKFIVIYFIAGIIGNIASFMFSISPAVGASGAIFGLLGALLYFGVERPEAFKRYFGSGVITTIIINIAYGISHSGIDNFAHLGGLAGGFLASGIVKYEKAAKKYLKTPLLIALTLLITVAGLFYGFNNNQNTILKKVETLRQLNAESKWSEAEKTGEEILSKNPSDINTRFQTLWALTYMEASTGNYEKAFKYANMMKDVDEPRSHYLLGALYFDTEQYDLAKQELEMAKAQNPDLVKEIDQLLNELNNVNK